jgi:hypothetical protein
MLAVSAVGQVSKGRDYWANASGRVGHWYSVRGSKYLILQGSHFWLIAPGNHTPGPLIYIEAASSWTVCIHGRNPIQLWR